MPKVSKKLRVLFLTPRLPYPPYRGDRLHAFNLLREASRQNEVSLLSFVASDDEGKLAENLRPLCRHVQTVRRSPLRSGLRCLGAIAGSTPFQVAYYNSTVMAEVLRSTVREFRPDVIHSHLIRMAQYRHLVPEVANVLDLTDAVSLYLTRFLETETRVPLRMALREELRRVRAYEPIIAQFEKTLVCSPADREFLSENVRRAAVEVLPNGVDTDLFAPQPQIEPDPNRVIFTGNMTYFPNRDGARFLVTEVWPLVKRRAPSAKLFLVGQNPPPTITRLASEDVVVTGFVPKIHEEYARSAVTVSPIRFGAGQLNKVLEPLAMGVPVVCTDIGISGLGLEHGRDVLVAGSAVELADCIVRLLANPTLRREVGTSAMERIRASFSWRAIGASLQKIYEQAVSREDH